MKMNKEMCGVIADLEYVIGSECYNPSSYDGWNDVEGCEFRYPINVPKGSGVFAKIKDNINTSPLIDQTSITPDTIKYIKYKFGANELFIGLGLIKALDYLEERYGLDFNALENQIGEKSNVSYI